WNLLSNAIKFTPDKGRVEVWLAEGPHSAVITVADTGRGIAAGVLPHIFERFRQSDATATTPGLGLGLSIVRHLVETHGGTIEATSAGAGQGATFVVTLPLGGGFAETPAEPAPPPAAGAASLLGLRVLIVDDDRDTRRLLAAALGDLGAVVSTVGSTREAMESFVRDTPDVVVSDIRLPGEDGYAFIRKVRALSPERGGRTPAVAVTAYPRAEDRARALEAGFQMHVTKPVPPHELAAVVAAVAGRTGAR
ncbi:MAG: ATP-binding protein, partial [Candidatus Rokuibacteriota bacterium]